MIAWLKRRLSLPDQTPPAIVLSIVFYLCHLVLAGWVASSESAVAFSMMAFLWAVAWWGVAVVVAGSLAGAFVSARVLTRRPDAAP